MEYTVDPMLSAISVIGITDDGSANFYQYLYFSRFSGQRVINIKHSAMCQHCFYDALIAH